MAGACSVGGHTTGVFQDEYDILDFFDILDMFDMFG